MKFSKKIIIIALAILSSLSAFSGSEITKWNLDEVKSNPGKVVMQLNPFPEYFKIQKDTDGSKQYLTVKMRTQEKEKMYEFKLNESITNKSVQVYGTREHGFYAANETAIVNFKDDKITVTLYWTRDDKDGWKTSNEYSLSFEKDGSMRFLRINGKNSEATYLEFEAIYLQD